MGSIPTAAIRVYSLTVEYETFNFADEGSSPSIPIHFSVNDLRTDVICVRTSPNVAISVKNTPFERKNGQFERKSTHISFDVIY